MTEITYSWEEIAERTGMTTIEGAMSRADDAVRSWRTR